MADALIEAIRARDLASVRAALQGPVPAQAMLAAAAWLPGLKVLQSKGGDLNAIYRGYRPLHSLLQEDAHKTAEKPSKPQLETLEWMLAHGADPELLGAWPPARAIIVAAFTGSQEFVDILRKHGAAVDDFAACALGDRKRRGRAVLARERDTNGMAALMYAAGSRLRQDDCYEIAAELVDFGAEIGVRVKSWRHEVDALYFAGCSHNAAIFELLLERGANPHEALTIAIWNGNKRIVDIAIANGALPDRATADGQPLLNNLIRWGRIDQALWLLAQGASPNIPDEKGWTAVHQAAARGNERALQAVLDSGGDFRRRDNSGDTPMDLAQMKGQRKTIALLEARGAK